ncbi:uncharacterized protein METZ01_LOCUS178137 [marine metagenome]|uniref:Uncharacterized protein n=1 Tax=marine metagenome TaxID=408172 RepID=A0A382CIW9_9ZZZZ|tara:strand:- start:665 stop:844 length:180 start_codon:yes stop_codon:yes gene_type:complete
MMLEAYLVYSHIRSFLKKLSIVDTKAQDVKTTNDNGIFIICCKISILVTKWFHVNKNKN